MILLKEWNAMSRKEQTLWLEENYQACHRSVLQRKMVCGIGVNDAKYCVCPKVDGSTVYDPAYRSWQNMISRAYNCNVHVNRPKYESVEVCNEWHSFSSFRTWWLANQVDGWQLDKDLIGDGVIYSPEKCIFVPLWLNSFNSDHGKSRGEWPIGVCFAKSKGKLKARCSNPKTGKVEHLGYFDSKDCAHEAWLKRKLAIALELKLEMDKIDERIYHRVVNVIKEAK